MPINANEITWDAPIKTTKSTRDIPIAPEAIVWDEPVADEVVWDTPPQSMGLNWREKSLREHPNLYGLYGVGKEFSKIGHLKYFWPEERKKLMELPPFTKDDGTFWGAPSQMKQLLKDTAEDVFIVGASPIFKGLGSIVGATAERFAPAFYKFWTKPRLVGKAKIAPVAKPEVPSGAKVMDLIGKRRSEIDKGILDSELFVRQFERQLSTKELEAIPFIRQGIKDPNVLAKIGREDLIPIIENPSKNVLQATDKIGKYYDEAFEFLKENWGDVGFVENYVTQIWNIPKNRRKDVVNYFMTRNPFLKKRTIPTLEEGIKLGLEPKTTNIARLLRIYDQYKIKTVHNFNFAKQLTKLTDDEGKNLIMRYDKAPLDWVTVDHNALNRAMAIGKVGKEGVLLTKVPVKVHPDIAKEIKIVFDKPFSHAAIRAGEVINAFTKKCMLTLSFFHHHALTESAFSTGIGRKAVGMWNPYKIVKALRNKDYEVFKRQKLAKDAIDHGVTFGALEDVQRNIVAKSLEGLERIAKNIPVVKQGTKTIRKANELWDAALWDYYHNALKLWAYEKNVQTGLQIAERQIQRQFKRSMNIEEITAVKKEMGSFVNDSFGGQNWDLHRVLGQPKVRQMLHWLLLAPDWTFSVLKQAAAPAKGIGLIAKKGVEQKLKGKALAARGGLFWAKAGFYFNLIAQSVNYYQTKKEYGEGQFTWDNAPGNKLNIFMGRNDDGTERYLRMGKQFREVLEWGIKPLTKLGAKLSPLLRESMRQFTAHDPGSGYPTEWAEEPFWGKKGLVERGKSILEMPIPFSLRPYVQSRPGVFMFTFPSKKGMSNYGAVKLFRKAIKDKNPDRIKEVYISALRNNLDAQSLFRSARSSIKADITFDNKTIAREILKEINGLDDEAKRDALMLYKEQGVLTPEIAIQLDRLMKKQEKVQRDWMLLRTLTQ